MSHATPETPWEAATDPESLFNWVSPASFGHGPNVISLGMVPVLPASLYRRLRLFGTGCVRQLWDILLTEHRSAVQVSERFADGQASQSDLNAVAVPIVGLVFAPRHCVQNAVGYAVIGQPYFPVGLAPDQRALVWQPFDAARWAARAMVRRNDNPGTLAAARAVQSQIFRDIFPPPDFTPTLEPRWLTSTVLQLARAMDTSGDFSAVPILADALEEAGCVDEPILNRCRSPGPHVRGNWVVDMILGRE